MRLEKLEGSCTLGAWAGIFWFLVVWWQNDVRGQASRPSPLPPSVTSGFHRTNLHEPEDEIAKLAARAAHFVTLLTNTPAFLLAPPESPHHAVKPSVASGCGLSDLISLEAAESAREANALGHVRV